jgi:hypothetical protein
MIDQKLIKLRDLVSYWEWKHSACHKFWINETYQELKQAKQNLKDYKSKNYPKTPFLPQPKPFLRMNDWTEQYENYAD